MWSCRNIFYHLSKLSNRLSNFNERVYRKIYSFFLLLFVNNLAKSKQLSICYGFKAILSLH